MTYGARRDIRLSEPSSSQKAIYGEMYKVPIEKGSLPVERRCIPSVYFDALRRTSHSRVTKACILLVPGYASSRKIFDLQDEAGDSFINYLALNGYDVFSMDLRGSRESIALGCEQASCLNTFLSHDIPTVVQFIKSLTGYPKITLIGHSMGAALCCGFAGLHPEDVASIVNIAGLYHYSVPIVNRLPELIPSPMKSAINIFSSAFDTLVVYPVKKILSRSSTRPGDSRLSSRNSASRKPSQISRWLSVLWKQNLPVLEFFSILFALERVLPVERILNKLMINVSRPFACRSLSSFVRSCTESPSIGVSLSLLFMGFHDDHYLRWVEDRDAPEGIIPHYWNELLPSLRRFELIPDLPIFFCYAKSDNILRVSDSLFGFTKSRSVWKQKIEYQNETNKSKAIVLDASPNVVRIDSGYIPDEPVEEPPKPMQLLYSSSHTNLYGYFKLNSEQELGQDKSESDDVRAKHEMRSLHFSNRPNVVFRDKKLTPTRSYILEGDYDFGHIDIFGGHKAQSLWKVIVEWLDDEAERERLWTHRRRFSI